MQRQDYIVATILFVMACFVVLAIYLPDGEKFFPKPMIGKEVRERAYNHGIQGSDLVEVGIIKLLDKIDRLEAECN